MFGRSSLPDNLPSLHSYSDALSWYNSTIPLRTGPDAGLMPLGSNRRYKRSQMLKAETKRGNAILCRFWKHDVIQFYEDGMVLFDIGHWHSPTTLMFLNDVYGGFTRYQGKIYLTHKDEFFYLNPIDGLWVNPNGSPHEPTPESTFVLTRTALNARKKKYKAFLDYAQDMVKVMEPKAGNELVEEFNRLLRHYGMEYWSGLTSNLGKSNARIPYLTIDSREIRYNRNKIVETRREFFRRVETACTNNDFDAMYPLMFVLQACASEQRWTGNGYVSECNPERLRKYFVELMKYEFCDEMFTSMIQPIGEKVSDRNSKYFIKPRQGY